MHLAELVAAAFGDRKSLDRHSIPVDLRSGAVDCRSP